ncbi:conjugal transfer protein (plasmid) [Phyllobacterium sp. 628]|uniref:type IV secretion system protein VirB10 n=1 Tax=Phyllobacterium sp. 628 TaxID=2718938 RepID=UPI0016627005|nr:type IV secretion system protein VirB10 [Phyllobacterium sp. 628]QND54375.1 conjugal transfer protein [Phyllobacterium sp. 628]
MPDHDYHRRMDADEDANSRLLEPKRGLKSGIVIFFLILGSVGLLAMPLLLNRARTVSDTENVPDGQFLPSHSDQLNLTPPPSRKEVAVAPQPVSKADTRASDTDDAEAQRRRAEEEAKRRAEAEEAANYAKRQDRYRSPMIVSELSPADSAAAQAEKKPEDPAKSPATFQAANPNDQFLASRSGAAVDVAKADKNKRIDALVPQGTILRGVLETAVQTDLPGMVRAVTTEDVWSFDGRRILIPSGSRLIGEYNAGVAEGQTRAFIVWTRLLRADGVSLSLGSIGTDELGRSGMGGDVNNHYLKRYGPAVLLSAISAAGQILAASNDTQNISSNPITTTVVNPVTGVSTSSTTYPNNNVGSNIAAKGAAVAAQSFTQLMGEALKSSLAIPPTITINQGAAVAIFVRRDLDFSELYPDPVREKLKELRHGRYSYEK